MTDDQIRATLKEWKEEEWNLYPYQQISDCLTELLAHRELHRSIKWKLWIPCDSVQGWKCVGQFEDKAWADQLKKTFCKDGLVLEANEQPCLTAR